MAKRYAHHVVYMLSVLMALLLVATIGWGIMQCGCVVRTQERVPVRASVSVVAFVFMPVSCMGDCAIFLSPLLTCSSWLLQVCGSL